MTDPQRDLALAVALFLALCALAVTCALWWRHSQHADRLAAVEAHQDAMHAWAADTHADVVDLRAAVLTDEAQPQPDPEPPTTPIAEHLDSWRDHFTFTEGHRP